MCCVQEVNDQQSTSRLWEHFGHQAAENFRFLHPGFISYVTHNFLWSPRLADVRLRETYMPSTGALMLMTALHTCDQVSAFGFLTRNYASFSDHYYDSVWRPLNFYANHDPPMEGQLWEELWSEDPHAVEERRQLREVQQLCSWSGFCGDLKPSHWFML